jgi:hypothetical protein
MMGSAWMDGESRREMALHRYIQAFERGDLDALAQVLEEAQFDPELDPQIAGVNAALHDEAGIAGPEIGAQTVRALLLRHMPTAALPPENEPAPTVGDVAARIQGDPAIRQQLLPADRLVNRGLLDSSAPLPIPATTATIGQLAQDLNVMASEHYWELFRREAVIAAMRHGVAGLHLTAARKRSTHRKEFRRTKGKDTKR